MAEYIDIDAPVVVTDTRGRERETTVRHILEMNKGVYTAADVRPVILCRDCKHSDTFAPECTESTFPLKCLSIRYGGVYPDWFCEHGEKREES